MRGGEREEERGGIRGEGKREKRKRKRKEERKKGNLVAESDLGKTDGTILPWR